MSRFQRWFFLILILLIGTVVVLAQEDACEIKQTSVIEIVDAVCDELDDNSVCYGNNDVNAVPRTSVNEFIFTQPGDAVNVVNVQSLYLSELSTEFDTWGIAKMNLLVSENSIRYPINLLLFGDTRIDTTQVSPEISIVATLPANIRNIPSSTAPVIASVSSGDILTAVARIEDSSWVQVSLEDGLVGWIFTSLTEASDASLTVTDLPVRSSQSRYWGPMQAFYIRNGESSACANQLVDGLFIQTPEGFARVSLLINEVTIDLIGSANGATAYVNTTEDNMNIAILDGAANVQAQDISYYVDTYQQTTIGINSNNQAITAPSIPSNTSVDTLINSPLLGLVRDMSLPFLPTTRETQATNGDTTTTTTQDNSENDNNGQGGDFGCGRPGNSCNAPGQNKPPNNPPENPGQGGGGGKP